MGMKLIRDQVAALRKQVIGEDAGRQWINFAAHPASTDEEIGAWLDEAVGHDWRRHFLCRWDDRAISSPVLIGNSATGDAMSNSHGLRFSEADFGLL